MHITLSEREYETVMNALLNAQHEFNFIHGLRVTDVPDVNYSCEIDCSQSIRRVEKAISILDDTYKKILEGNIERSC